VSDKKTRRPADYSVGYGRPPKATQFAVGNRANPAGRPKGSRTVAAVLQDVLQRKIAVTENGKTRWIPVLEAMILRLANEAMRSDPGAVKLLLALNDRYSGSPETAIRFGDILAEDRVILAQCLQNPIDQTSEDPLKPGDEANGDGL
jgi:hypothetical protein